MGIFSRLRPALPSSPTKAALAPAATSSTSSTSSSPPAATGDATDEALRDLLRRVRQVELRAKKQVSASTSGAWHSRYKGRGMSFSESRAFADGDDPRHVDWLATARTGDLFVKQFVEERELTLLLVVDLSASMTTGSRASLRRHLAAEVAAVLALSAGRNQDKVGLVGFTTRVERLVRPAKGRSHVLRLIRDVLALQPAERRTALSPALDAASHLSRQRSIIVVISDLVGVTLPVERLRSLAMRHDVCVVQLTDPLDRDLPDVGLLSVTDPESGEATLVDTADKHVRAAWHDGAVTAQAKRVADLRRAGVEHVEVVVGDDESLRPLMRFLRQRGKRAA
jgi:uncharacterized protein (DUF58 family)